MINRRSFLKTALMGGGAFAAGMKLSEALSTDSSGRVVMHGFVPADEAALQETLSTFLALEAGRLPAPTVDVATAWRSTVAGALRTGADRFQRDSHRMLSVQVTALDRALPADVMLQQDSRVLDPASGFGRRMLNLRDRLVGQEATLAVSCRLEDRPGNLNQDRVLVVENERGVQERIALDGTHRSLNLNGPAGRTDVKIDGHGVRVAEASCRHATCRLQGAIARPGELIACAPNRLVLRVETA